MLILECSETIQLCYNARKILVIIKELIKIIQWSVPLLLVVLGTIDMFKAVTHADDEKATKEATRSFIRRLIYGVIIFLVPFFVRLVLNFVESNFISNNEDVSATSWLECWNHVEDKSYFANKDCDDIYQKENDNSNNNNNTNTRSGALSTLVTPK